MSAPAILRDALGGDAARFTLAKPGARKSASQAHSWFAVHRGRVELVLKFDEAGPATGIPARQRLARERQFLEAVASLPADDPLRAHLPALVAAGEVHGRHYLVTRFDPRPAGHRHVHRRDAACVRQVHEGLALLARLQAHRPLAEALGLADGESLVHGDYNGHNLLGGGHPLLVIDWEDWSAGRCPWRDALHLVAVPLLGGGGGAAAEGAALAAGLAGPWAGRFAAPLAPFLAGQERHTAVADYLAWQEQLLCGRAPELAATYAVARGHWAGGAA